MGILAMLAGLTLLILVHEFGHWVVARFFGFQTPVFSIGFGKPYLVIGRRWNTEFRLTPWLLGGYVEVPELGDESTLKEQAAQQGKDPSAFKQFPVWKRFLVAVAGVTMNVILAVVLLFSLYAFVGKPNYQDKDTYISEFSTTNNIARDAGFQANDVFVSVNGTAVKTPDDVIQDISPHKGTPISVTVSRQGHLITIKVTPGGDGRIGVVLGAHQLATYKRVGIVSATFQSGWDTTRLTGKIVQSVGVMLHIVPVPKEYPPNSTDVHGMVGVVEIGASAFHEGVFNFVWVLVVISLNLAVFNILPIPVLDGGYLLFMAIEKIRGRPVDVQVQNRIKAIFIGLLLALMALGLFNDITKPLRLGH